MLRYALRRLLGAVPTLFLVIVLAFLLVHAAPGGPFDDQRVLPPEIEANIAAAYHLDEPLVMQFLRYIGGVLRGDFGPSFSYRDYTVSELIGRSFPISLQLGALAMLLAAIVGVGTGIVAALRQNSPLDKVVMGFAMTGISIPVFVIAPLLVLLFAPLALHLSLGRMLQSAESRLGSYALVLVSIAMATTLLGVMLASLSADHADALYSRPLGWPAATRWQAELPPPCSRASATGAASWSRPLCCARESTRWLSISRSCCASA